jgi:hypothetical protein
MREFEEGKSGDGMVREEIRGKKGNGRGVRSEKGKEERKVMNSTLIRTLSRWSCAHII